MFYRFRDPRHPAHDPAAIANFWDKTGIDDPIFESYRWMNDTVAEVEKRLGPRDVLLIVSDHGFHSFRYGMNLNTWLVEHGYMTFQGQSQEKKLQDLFGRGKFWEGVDWSKTRAYAVGLGQIYFNLKGREARGVVSAGAEYKALQEEIATKLVELVDPDTKDKVFRAIYRRDDIYKGEYIREAPDLQVGFNDGYRVGWQDTLGTIRRAVVENNNKKWSGDHCATATEISGGVFFSNRKIATEEPNILDLAPTILYLFGLPVARDMEGRVLTEILDPDFARSHAVTFIPSYESLAISPATAELPLEDLPPLPEEEP